MPACTPATIFSTLCVGPLRPNREAVASAPCTTSTRMMKTKNTISAVEQPKKAQKILRAKASRKVSRTRARAAVVLFALHRELSLLLNVLRGFYRLHKHLFQGAGGAREVLDLA